MADITYNYPIEDSLLEKQASAEAIAILEKLGITDPKKRLSHEEFVKLARAVKELQEVVSGMESQDNNKCYEIINVTCPDPSLGCEALVNSGTLDQTEKIDKFMALGRTLYFPKGQYAATHISLRTNTSIIGESQELTQLVCLDESGKIYDKNDSNPFIEFPTLWRRSCLEKIEIKYNGNNHRTAIQFKPTVRTSINTGGAWYTRISDIYIFGFTGHSLSFVCNDLEFGAGLDIANQFIYSSNVVINHCGRGSIDNSPVYIEGQLNNMLFNNLSITYEGGVKEVGDYLYDEVKDVAIYLKDKISDEDVPDVFFDNLSVVNTCHTAIYIGDHCFVSAIRSKFENQGCIVYNSSGIYRGFSNVIFNNVSRSLSGYGTNGTKSHSYISEGVCSTIEKNTIAIGLSENLNKHKNNDATINADMYVNLDIQGLDAYYNEKIKSTKNYQFIGSNGEFPMAKINLWYNNSITGYKPVSRFLGKDELISIKILNHSDSKDRPVLLCKKNGFVRNVLLFPGATAWVKRSDENWEIINVVNNLTTESFIKSDTTSYETLDDSGSVECRVFLTDTKKEVNFYAGHWYSCDGSIIK